MTNKETEKAEIQAEELKYLGYHVDHGENVPIEKEVAGYESIKVELLAPNGTAHYQDWVFSSHYAALVTWDSEFNRPVTQLSESVENDEDVFPEIEKQLINILKDRPISVALENAKLTFKLTGIPRSMTHQLVRHRDMAFGQQSFRVSPAYHDPVRAPQSLLEAAESPENEIARQLIVEYEQVVATCRDFYKKLIKNDVATEQARNIMPMGTLTKIVMSTDLAFFIKYVGGRTNDITQDEHTLLVAHMLLQLKINQPGFYSIVKQQVRYRPGHKYKSVDDVITDYSKYLPNSGIVETY